MSNSRPFPLDDRDLIDSIYTDELIRRNGTALRTVVEEMVCRIVQYENELGSSQNFIKWFRWSPPSELLRTFHSLNSIGAAKSAKICEKAIEVAFPSGIPNSVTAYKTHLYDLECEPANKKQREQLVKLAKKQLAQLNETTGCLANWIRETQ